VLTRRTVATVLLALAISGAALAGGRRFLVLDAGVPSVSSTGLGTTGTSAIEAGSVDTVGVIVLTPGGTGIAKDGTVTLTLSQDLGIHVPVCLISLQDGTDQWDSEKGIVIVAAGISTTAVGIRWHNGASLAAGSTYNLSYHCLGK